jgi:hypothetical protein
LRDIQIKKESKHNIEKTYFITFKVVQSSVLLGLASLAPSKMLAGGLPLT